MVNLQEEYIDGGQDHERSEEHKDSISHLVEHLWSKASDQEIE